MVALVMLARFTQYRAPIEGSKVSLSILRPVMLTLPMLERFERGRKKRCSPSPDEGSRSVQ